VLRKYFDGTYSGHLTIGKDGSGFRADCTLHLDSGMMLEADASAMDAYASADEALLLLEKRLRRYKNRLKDHHRKANGSREIHVDAPSYVIEAPDHDDEHEDGFNPVIIAESTTAFRQMAVSEAVVQLDLSGAPVVVFRHGSSGRINVIYRRADGNIGWVDPPEATSHSASNGKAS
jgi:ribosomal subunit interface protein